MFLVAATQAGNGADEMVINPVPVYADQHLSYDQSPPNLYRGNELSLDAFGSDALGQSAIEHASGNRISHSSRLGAGLGINYFITRYVGLGAEAITENTAHSFMDGASGSLILRLPIGQTGLAPYAFGGGGHQWGPIVANYGVAGVGLEYRFTPHTALFLDGRGVFSNKAGNNGLARAGFRFAF